MIKHILKDNTNIWIVELRYTDSGGQRHGIDHNDLSTDFENSWLSASVWLWKHSGVFKGPYLLIKTTPMEYKQAEGMNRTASPSGHRETAVKSVWTTGIFLKVSGTQGFQEVVYNISASYVLSVRSDANMMRYIYF